MLAWKHFWLSRQGPDWSVGRRTSTPAARETGEATTRQLVDAVPRRSSPFAPRGIPPADYPGYATGYLGDLTPTPRDEAVPAFRQTASGAARQLLRTSYANYADGYPGGLTAPTRRVGTATPRRS